MSTLIEDFEFILIKDTLNMDKINMNNVELLYIKNKEQYDTIKLEVNQFIDNISQIKHNLEQLNTKLNVFKKYIINLYCRLYDLSNDNIDKCMIYNSYNEFLLSDKNNIILTKVNRYIKDLCSNNFLMITQCHIQLEKYLYKYDIVKKDIYNISKKYNNLAIKIYDLLEKENDIKKIYETSNKEYYFMKNYSSIKKRIKNKMIMNIKNDILDDKFVIFKKQRISK
jgi:hypothetical protein